MLGDNSFSGILIRCYYRKYFSQYNNNNERKENLPAGGRPETHLRKQVVLSRIFKRIVPVDYSSQSKKEYQEHFLLLVQ